MFVRMLAGEMRDHLLNLDSGGNEARSEGDGGLGKEQARVREQRGRGTGRKRGDGNDGLKGRIVSCDEVQAVVFGFGTNHGGARAGKSHRREKPREVSKDIEEEWRSVDMLSDTDDASEGYEAVAGVQHADHIVVITGDGKAETILDSPTEADMDRRVGGEKGKAETTTEMETEREKQMEGQRRAEEREMVRRAARRGIVFGFVLGDEDETDRHGGRERGKANEVMRKCEAVMKGVVVEPSFAKGNWGVRWRDER